ncbi:MAG: SH3 domain-containing protein, partial [bacterium]
NFKLASATITLTSPAISSASAVPSPSAIDHQPLTIDKPYVLIGETGTGWLRVRKDASGTSDELGKANTGEKLKYLGESTDLGWHQVEFEGSQGWVSGKYTTIVK